MSTIQQVREHLSTITGEFMVADVKAALGDLPGLSVALSALAYRREIQRVAWKDGKRVYRVLTARERINPRPIKGPGILGVTVHLVDEQGRGD